ncbi:MAG: hypothetical protein ACEY3D_00385 [Rickettsia sp.]
MLDTVVKPRGDTVYKTII